jgi:choline dehydrogenase
MSGSPIIDTHRDLIPLANVTRRKVLAAGTTVAMMAMTNPGTAAGTRTKSSSTKTPFDVVIVGGGSAGAVLAARLSADAQRRVLLLDAGPNFAVDGYPSVLMNANVVVSPDFDWQYHTEDAARLGHNVPVPPAAALLEAARL